jgi:hypothetical protein
VFEVEYHSQAQLCDSQIIEHLPPLVVCNAVDGLGVHDHRIIGNEIGDKSANLDPAIYNGKPTTQLAVEQVNRLVTLTSQALRKLQFPISIDLVL